MNKFFYIFILSGLVTFGQQDEEAVYRKLSLQSCRCIKESGDYFITEEKVKACDLLAYEFLTSSEKAKVSYDNSSQEAYIAFSAKILPFRKDYCPQVVNFFDKKKKEQLFEEQQRIQRANRKLAEEQRLTEEQTQIEEIRSADKQRILELEKLLDECVKSKAVEAEQEVIPAEETKKERKAREKREKEALKNQND